MKKRAFAPDDVWNHRTVGDIRSAPDGALCACSIKAPNRDEDAYRHSIWGVPLDGAEPFPLTTQRAGNDTHPRWSPDGTTLAFLSDRAGDTKQVFLMPRAGGEAQQLTHTKHDIASFEWSPDGSTLLATMAVAVDSADRGGAGGKRAKGVPDVAWRVPYKLDGSGFTLNEQVHLFRIDVEGGDEEQLTRGAFDVREGTWSPDGKRIVYSRTREARDAHRTDLWIANADGSEAWQATHELSSVHSPRWSPDGRFIAFAANAIDGDSYVQPFLYDVERRRAQQMGDDDVELAIGSSIEWDRDSSRIWFIVARQGLQEIASLSLDGTLERRIKGERHATKFALAGERVVYAWVSIRDPNEVFVGDRDGGHEQRLTRFNAWWDECELPRVRFRRMNVPDGRGNHEDIDAWVVTPPNGGDGPYPTLFDKHGGPQSYALLEFDPHVHWLALAARGWAVVAANPGGSSSYGQEFARRLRGKWGELDLPQCLEEVAIMRREGVSDDRVAVAGKSYGGFMAAWVVTQTDVFKAAIASAPVANVESHFGTSDTGYYVSPYAMAAEPQEDRETYRRLSPVQHMHRCTTPTLFLQGMKDQRCPLGQSEELFATLMRATNTPAELVMYPGAGHHLAETGRPSQRVDYFTRIVDWLDRHANARGDKSSPATHERQNDEKQTQPT